MANEYNELETFENGVKRRNRVELLGITPSGLVLCDRSFKSGLINLPGGAIDVGETPEEAAVRECMEEAGWVCKNPVLIDVPGEWVYKVDGSAPDWVLKSGWKEESNRFVFANALAFKPDARFGSHGDSAEFEELPLEQLIDNTEKGASGALHLPNKLQFAAQFRKAALTAFMEKYGRDLVRPKKASWSKW